MSEILRTWQCQNEACSAQFDAWENYPACPNCGNVRVSWVPKGGHIAGKSPGLDAELRNLVDAFKLTDLASAKEGERAMPALRSPASSAPAGPQMQFAPGFSAAPYARDTAGKVRAVGQWSSQGVDFKVKPAIGSPLSQPARARMTKA